MAKLIEVIINTANGRRKRCLKSHRRSDVK